MWQVWRPCWRVNRLLHLLMWQVDDKPTTWTWYATFNTNLSFGCICGLLKHLLPAVSLLAQLAVQLPGLRWLINDFLVIVPQVSFNSAECKRMDISDLLHRGQLKWWSHVYQSINQFSSSPLRTLSILNRSRSKFLINLCTDPTFPQRANTNNASINK